MKRSTWIVLALGIVAAIGLWFQPSPFTEIRACIRAYSWPPALFNLTNSADARIFIAYVWLPIILLRLRPKLGIPFDWIFSLFAAFIVSCGLTHVLGILTGYVPWYWLAYDMKEITADVSLATAAALQWVVGPKLEAEVAKYRKALEAEKARTEEEKQGREVEALARTEAERREVQLVLALEREQRLREALAESGAPVLRLGNRTLVLVVVGPVAAERAEVLMIRACKAIEIERARAMVIDVSAVQEMDTGAVGALGQVAGAVDKMGARCIFAGIGAEIAMTMSRAGIQFGGGAGTALDTEAALLLLAKH